MVTGIPQFWALAVFRRLGQIGVYSCFFILYIALVRLSLQDKNVQIGVYPYFSCGGNVTPSITISIYILIFCGQGNKVKKAHISHERAPLPNLPTPIKLRPNYIPLIHRQGKLHADSRHFASPRVAGRVSPLNFAKPFLCSLTLLFLWYCFGGRGRGK